MAGTAVRPSRSVVARARAIGVRRIGTSSVVASLGGSACYARREASADRRRGRATLWSTPPGTGRRERARVHLPPRHHGEELAVDPRDRGQTDRPEQPRVPVRPCSRAARVSHRPCGELAQRQRQLGNVIGELEPARTVSPGPGHSPLDYVGATVQRPRDQAGRRRGRRRQHRDAACPPGERGSQRGAAMGAYRRVRWFIVGLTVTVMIGGCAADEAASQGGVPSARPAATVVPAFTPPSARPGRRWCRRSRRRRAMSQPRVPRPTRHRHRHRPP